MLEKIRIFEVDCPLVEETERALREAGDDGYEMFVLWSGGIRDDVLHVRNAHFPEQRSYKTDGGVLVRVEGAALHRLNAWLYEHGETLAAQVHAHPTDAFHSDTDDAYPIVTALGGLSVVAPDFARRGVITRGTAAYRLTPGGWTRVPSRRLNRVVKVLSP